MDPPLGLHMSIEFFFLKKKGDRSLGNPKSTVTGSISSIQSILHPVIRVCLFDREHFKPHGLLRLNSKRCKGKVLGACGAS